MAKQGYYTHGNKPSPIDKNNWVPRIDKDPYYRTNDIMNGVYRRSTRLAQGERNSTDLRTIWVNFGETVPSPIVAELRVGKSPGNRVYQLECGHEWEGKLGHSTDGSESGECYICGADESYSGFEHEWEHIIFKSDLAARALFCSAYATQLAATAPGINSAMLENFLSLLVNAFDDLRVNSLWEKVYPGSAEKIWKRWRRLTVSHGDLINKSFLSFVFAVAFDIPTSKDSEFEPLRPVVEWGVKKVKYRGFMNMLVDLRAVVDRCMGQMISQFQQPLLILSLPGQTGGGGYGNQGHHGLGSDGDQNKTDSPRTGKDNDPGERQGGDSNRDPGSGSQERGRNPGQDHESDVDSDKEEQKGQEEKPSLDQIPSASNIQGKEQEKANALNRLMLGAKVLDPSEEHRAPTPEQLADARSSQSTAAMLHTALQTDVSDADKLDNLLQDGVVDPDMDQALTQLMNGVAQKSKTSLLTSDTKAKILLIDVHQKDIHSSSKVVLDEEERIHVRRMRAAFYRALGRQKAKRSADGEIIDVQALIAYLQDHEDPDVFENDAAQRGFAYSTLCDMSASMRNTFPDVCRATEMLKQALHFPFVLGHLWGFRGGQSVPNRTSDYGEVWIYRYDKDVNGYTGMASVANRGRVSITVGCGGNTPMNPAIKVAVNHLWKQIPAGMVKRLFLLTDGSPFSNRVGTGAALPEWMLRRFVAKEIGIARKHGIQVYTIVIGANAIPEEQCKEMFGSPRFWRRVVEPHEVGNVLARLVLDNFQKYLKSRG